MENTSLRAYELSDIHCHRDGPVIVFALSPAKAKAQWKDFRYLRNADFKDVRVKRAPTFDDATQPEPTEADYMARGWSVPCYADGCCNACGGADGATTTVIENGRVFCSPRCFKAWQGVSNGDTKC